MFNHYLRVLAHIPRWSVLPVIRRQSVAEHSFFVSVYVSQLLDHPRFKAKHSEWKEKALRYALVHDAAEARTGDLPGPIKRAIIDRDKFEGVEAAAMSSMGLNPYCDEDIRLIVKAADAAEEYFYLASEAQMGSKVVKVLLRQAEERLEKAFRNAGVHDWMTKVVSQAHKLDDGLVTLYGDDHGCNCAPHEFCEKCQVPF